MKNVPKNFYTNTHILATWVGIETTTAKKATQTDTAIVAQNALLSTLIEISLKVCTFSGEGSKNLKVASAGR